MANGHSSGPEVIKLFSLFVHLLCINQFPPGCFKICVLVYVGNTQRLTESGFMEKPGIEPVIPGLQDIGLSPTPWRLLIKTKLPTNKEVSCFKSLRCYIYHANKC